MIQLVLRGFVVDATDAAAAAAAAGVL